MLSRIAVLFMATALCAVVILHYGQRNDIQMRAGLAKGKQIPPTSNISYAASVRTILLVISPECTNCGARNEMYERLYSACKKRTPPIPVVGVSAQSDAQVRSYLEQYHPSFPILSGVSWIDPWLSKPGAILLVDSQGRIIDYWQGDVSPDVQDEIFAEVKE
jgi:hypothetical protein